MIKGQGKVACLVLVPHPARLNNAPLQRALDHRLYIYVKPELQICNRKINMI